MRILLTGGSGFLGRNLQAHLSGDHVVIAPSHGDLDLTDDVSVDAWFGSNEVDAVIHSAVRPGHRAAIDPSRQLWSNLRMFFNLVRHEDRFSRLVFLSSGAVYDTSVPIVLADERSLGERVPDDDHGLSKFSIAKYLDARGPQAEPRSIELRLFGIYGPHEDYSIRFISNAICRALCGLPITLTQDRRFSYLYVDDLMPVVDWALTAEPRHVAYNVCPSWTDNLAGLGEMVARRSGKPISMDVTTPGTGKEYTGDSTRLRTELPSLSFTMSDVGVDRLFRWYQDRRSAIDVDRLVAVG
jgi:GDP-L-fucose synthase